jgi:uncharacterized protein (TIGR00106 family)
MSVLLEFSMFPTDKGESVSAYVSRAIDAIRSSGYPYRLTPMGTVIETPTVAEALTVVQAAYDALAPHSNRIYSSLKMDIRHGRDNRLEGKIASVQKHIGEVNT